jgi:transposase-like protein
MDFLLTAQREYKAAQRFVEKGIRQHDIRENLTINGQYGRA